jgi:hypothetical protein
MAVCPIRRQINALPLKAEIPSIDNAYCVLNLVCSGQSDKINPLAQSSTVQNRNKQKEGFPARGSRQQIKQEMIYYDQQTKVKKTEN